jgi:hypothetical protein
MHWGCIDLLESIIDPNGFNRVSLKKVKVSLAQCYFDHLLLSSPAEIPYYLMHHTGITFALLTPKFQSFQAILAHPKPIMTS